MGKCVGTAVCVCLCVCPVVAESLQLLGLYPARLLCPCDFPGKNTGVSCYFLLQGIFLTQGSNLGLLHCRQILHHFRGRKSSPKWLHQCFCPQTELWLPPASLAGSLISTSGSDPGFFQMTTSALDPGPCEILCAAFEDGSLFPMIIWLS